MTTLATQVAKGEKELNNNTIIEMLESHMDKAHKVLLSGYDKNKAWDMFFNILKNKIQIFTNILGFPK